jgi:hypothetical protein
MEGGKEWWDETMEERDSEMALGCLSAEHTQRVATGPTQAFSQLVEYLLTLRRLDRHPARRVLLGVWVRQADEPAPDALVVERPDARGVVERVRVDAEHDVRERCMHTHAQRRRDDAGRAIGVDECLDREVIRREVQAMTKVLFIGLPRFR